MEGVRADAGRDGKFQALHTLRAGCMRKRWAGSVSHPVAHHRLPELTSQPQQTGLASNGLGLPTVPIKWPHGAGIKEADEDVNLSTENIVLVTVVAKGYPLGDADAETTIQPTATPPPCRTSTWRSPRGPLVSNHQMSSEVSRLGGFNKGSSKNKGR